MITSFSISCDNGTLQFASRAECVSRILLPTVFQHLYGKIYMSMVERMMWKAMKSVFSELRRHTDKKKIEKQTVFSGDVNFFRFLHVT